MRDNLKAALVTLLLAILAIVFASSCRTGYGCHGNESWRGMVRRINGYGYVPNIKRPTRRELNKAMSYSTWEYNNVLTADYALKYSRSSDHLK